MGRGGGGGLIELIKEGLRQIMGKFLGDDSGPTASHNE